MSPSNTYPEATHLTRAGTGHAGRHRVDGKAGSITARRRYERLYPVLLCPWTGEHLYGHIVAGWDAGQSSALGHRSGVAAGRQPADDSPSHRRWRAARDQARRPSTGSSGRRSIGIASDAAIARRRSHARVAEPHEPVHFGLERPHTPLIGRVQELAELCAALSSERSALITLTGPGGVGKTRLALEAAARVEHAFPDGVHVVGLAPVRDAELVPPAIAQSFGLEGGSSGDAVDRIARVVGDRRILLMLDNLEQVARGRAIDVPALPSLSAPDRPEHQPGATAHYR